MSVDIFQPLSKEYGLLLTNPPWPQHKGGIRSRRPNQGHYFSYPTCQLVEIKSIHQAAVSHLSEKHNVFLWMIDKYLLDAETMMGQLGYTLHARMIGDKGNGPSPAFTVPFTHEYLLWFYRKDRMLKTTAHARGVYGTALQEASTAHSRKPICVYEMLDSMVPEAKKLELFARNRKRGWDSWGNEMELFGEVS